MNNDQGTKNNEQEIRVDRKKDMSDDNKETFKDKLKRLMDEYAHLTYDISTSFPKEEVYGITSQFRRAVLSVILNYIEGYARKRPLVQLNFYETAYGSLQESLYLVEFCEKRKLI